MQTPVPSSHLEDFLSKVSLVGGIVNDSSSFMGTMDFDVASLAILQMLVGLREYQEGVCFLIWGLGPCGHAPIHSGYQHL